MDKVLLLLCVLGLIPVVISVDRGRRGHDPPWKLVVDAVGAGYLSVLILSFLLPSHSIGAHVAMVSGSLLWVLGVWKDVRDWRRLRRAAEPTVAAAERPAARTKVP